jgi:hypothetical protein
MYTLSYIQIKLINYTTKEATLFNLKFIALKSTRKYSCDVWHLDDPAGRHMQKFL